MTTGTISKRALFPLGRILATPGALAALRDISIDPSGLIARHESGDWGNLDAHDISANDAALMRGERILSAYVLGDTGVKVYVITEWDRSSTTLMLANEY